MATDRRAFTLVELLVVVGIVAVLAALLMPALSGAREAANRVKCLATLRSMAQAAHLHAAEHHGYMPVAGPQEPFYLGVKPSPEGLLDPQQKKYIYYWHRGNSVWRPLPLPAALGHYMGLGEGLRGTEADPRLLEQVVQSEAVWGRFACPSQDPEAMRLGYTLTGGGSSDVNPLVKMSYIFNSQVLARRIYRSGAEAPAGKLSRVKSPCTVFLFADGNSAGPMHWAGYGITGDVDAGVETLYDYWDPLRQWGQFDERRHRGKMNVAFVDGHAETAQMPVYRSAESLFTNRGDFQRIGLHKGIMDN